MFHKIVKKAALFLTVAAVSISPFSLSVNAANVLNYRFAVNLSDIGVYYSDTYASYHGEYTMGGAFRWKNDSRLNFIYFNRVSSSSASDVYCRMFSNGSSNVLASTTFYYGSSLCNPDNHNWDNCKLEVNHAKTVTLPTFVHEFGHVLGLDDTNSDPTSIMCQTAAGRTATSPSYTDYTSVYQKYSPYI